MRCLLNDFRLDRFMEQDIYLFTPTSICNFIGYGLPQTLLFLRVSSGDDVSNSINLLLYCLH